jgi:Ribosomal protein S6
MALYECTFICRHDMSPADVQKLTAEMKHVITDGQGKVIKEEQWGLRTLAYKLTRPAKAITSF